MLGRCALYQSLLQGKNPENAKIDIDLAIANLRASGALHHLPRGLITRGWLRGRMDDNAGARADLDEAWRIASRGGMKLHQADICLYRAKLFGNRDALLEARALIMGCGYSRRIPELKDTEASFGLLF